MPPFAGTDKIDPQISPLINKQGGGGGGGVISFSDQTETAGGAFSMDIDFFQDGTWIIHRDAAVHTSGTWFNGAPDPLIFGFFEVRTNGILRGNWSFPSAADGVWTPLSPVGGNPKRWSENITFGGINVRALFEIRGTALGPYLGEFTSGIVDFTN